jgi:hypothetical protein
LDCRHQTLVVVVCDWNIVDGSGVDGIGDALCCGLLAMLENFFQEEELVSENHKTGLKNMRKGSPLPPTSKAVDDEWAKLNSTFDRAWS